MHDRSFFGRKFLATKLGRASMFSVLAMLAVNVVALDAQHRAGGSAASVPVRAAAAA